MMGAALALASRGLAVFPLLPRKKFPLTINGFKDGVTDLEQVRAWWTKHPTANIGIATGIKSGVWVLDIDADKGGEKSLAEIEQRFYPLPATVEVITGSGGRHLYFRLRAFDGAPTIRCSVGKVAAGIDIRGEGGYVVAPPSIHPSGRPYSWSVDSADAFVEAPVWFLETVQPESKSRT